MIPKVSKLISNYFLFSNILQAKNTTLIRFFNIKCQSSNLKANTKPWPPGYQPQRATVTSLVFLSLIMKATPLPGTTSQCWPLPTHPSRPSSVSLYQKPERLSFDPDCPHLFFSVLQYVSHTDAIYISALNNHVSFSRATVFLEMCLVLLQTSYHMWILPKFSCHLSHHHVSLSGITSGLSFNPPYSLIEINNWESLYTRSATFVFSELGSKNSSLEENKFTVPKWIKYLRKCQTWHERLFASKCTSISPCSVSGRLVPSFYTCRISLDGANPSKVIPQA